MAYGVLTLGKRWLQRPARRDSQCSKDTLERARVTETCWSPKRGEPSARQRREFNRERSFGQIGGEPRYEGRL